MVLINNRLFYSHIFSGSSSDGIECCVHEEPPILWCLATQQYLLLQRNLVYAGVTRGKSLVVVVGQRKALAIAVRNNKTEQRFLGLLARLIA